MGLNCEGTNLKLIVCRNGQTKTLIWKFYLFRKRQIRIMYCDTMKPPQFYWTICVEVVQVSSTSQVTQSQRHKVSSFQWTLYSCPILPLSCTMDPWPNFMPKICNIWIFGTYRPCIWKLLFPFFVDSFSALSLQCGKAHIEAREANLRLRTWNLKTWGKIR